MKKCFFISLFLCAVVMIQAQTSYSTLVYPGENGKLVYKPYTEKGDIIPDFSYCGYGGGGVALPQLPVVATIHWDNRVDHTAHIQAVIDSVAGLTPDAQGFRGAILIKKGVYRIESPLRVQAGGIVLRGEGNDKYDGTVLLATGLRRYNVIEIGGRGRFQPTSKEYAVTDDYVPSGTRVLHVAKASSNFKVGDPVIVRRPSTEAWIHAIDMDSIPPRPLRGESTYDSFNRLRTSGSETNMNGTKQWLPGSKDLYFERTITAIKGNEITLDIPLANALQKEYGGGLLFTYEYPDRITQCGVENIYGMSVYDEDVKMLDKHIGWYCSDEKHANNFIVFRSAEQVWVKDVSVEHFDCCVSTSPSTKFLTGKNLSATNPVSVITGGRRYAYSVSGQMNLFENCYSNYHRHEFVLGSTVAGPNAFVNGLGDMTFASSEPHQRWATGCLFDNITIKGPEGSLLAVNRGWYGSGHGWSGAQMVFWNCSAPVIMVMQPPTAQNFIIGSSGVITEQNADNACLKTIGAINGVSRSNFRYKGVSAVGDGWIESPTEEVFPKSLYYMQLKDRKPEIALKIFPKEADPESIGRLVANRFVESPHNSFRPPAPPKSITYPEVCAWYGALGFAKVTNDKKLLKQLEERFIPLYGEEKSLQPRPVHVDYNVFGAVPSELYMQTGNKKYLETGLFYADTQWSLPVDSPQVSKDRFQEYLDKGLTWQTRYWIDDMYMITMVQSQAYRATGERTYIDRAAHEMHVYLDTIQRPNGLFYHAPDAPFFWGRGNGWMAAGMSELLSSLPEDNKDRKAIMQSYLTMMKSLKQYQRADGLWGQLIDDPTSWVETSGSAMFTYAFIMGVKNGWLDPKEYAPAAQKAWIALVKYINADGDISDVCEGTNRKNDYQYYLDRKRRVGDMHGQAPVLWCVSALLEM